MSGQVPAPAPAHVPSTYYDSQGNKTEDCCFEVGDYNYYGARAPAPTTDKEKLRYDLIVRWNRMVNRYDAPEDVDPDDPSDTLARRQAEFRDHCSQDDTKAMDLPDEVRTTHLMMSEVTTSDSGSESNDPDSDSDDDSFDLHLGVPTTFIIPGFAKHSVEVLNYATAVVRFTTATNTLKNATEDVMRTFPTTLPPNAEDATYEYPFFRTLVQLHKLTEALHEQVPNKINVPRQATLTEEQMTAVTGKAIGINLAVHELRKTVESFGDGPHWCNILAETFLGSPDTKSFKNRFGLDIASVVAHAKELKQELLAEVGIMARTTESAVEKAQSAEKQLKKIQLAKAKEANEMLEHDIEARSEAMAQSKANSLTLQLRSDAQVTFEKMKAERDDWRRKFHGLHAKYLALKAEMASSGHGGGKAYKKATKKKKK